MDTTDGHEPSLPTPGKSALILADSASASTTEVGESSQSLSIWDTVDVPGSPLLSRLFEALQIECPTEIPPISIGSPVAASAESYIADIEMGGICNREQFDDAVEKDAPRASSMPNCSSVALRREDSPLSCPEWNLPDESFDEWAFSQWDFSKGHPFNIEMNTGPMRPISQFPISPSTDARGTCALTSIVPFGRLKELEMGETYYKSKLGRFKRLLSADDPRTVEIMRSLAAIYCKQSKYRQEERLLRLIAKSTQKTCGFKHRETLSDYLSVVKVLDIQGKFRQAAKIHQLVHATIQSLIGPEDKLSILSTNYLSDLCYGLCQYEEADKLDRQILQIRLNTLGPRHTLTLRGINRLAMSLRQSGKLLEGERLLSIVLQFQHEVQGIDDELVCSEIELAKVLGAQGRYGESKYLALKAAERSKISFGPEHDTTLYCFYIIARCLAMLGQHAESESLLRKVLERQLERFGEFNRSTVETMEYLAWILVDMGRYQEAVTYCENCFRAYLENYGMEHTFTVDACDGLGQCYEKLGRYEDAFSLYRRTINQLQSRNPDDNPVIVRISSWISELRDTLAAEQEDVCHEQDEMDDGKTLSGSVWEQEVSGYSNSVNDGEAVTGEYWMNEFVDFQTPKEDGGELGHPDRQI